MIRALALGLALAFAVIAPARAIEVREVVSPAGHKAWLVEDHSIPFVALELRFKGGASLDAPGKRGAVNLMTALLEEGAGRYDSRGYAEAREELAARIAFDVGDDALSVSARMLTENRDRAVELIRLALTEPHFDAPAVERVRAQVLSGIRADAEDPGALAGRAFDERLFGSHPYATALDGTIESVGALTRDDLVAAHRATIAADRLFVAAVGDISVAELGALIDRIAGGLPETGAPMPPRVEPALAAEVKVVPYDTPQSVVVWGLPGLRLDDPDFFAANVLNQALGGGGFSSRLMNELREKRGLTYGAYSYLLARDLAETWQGSFASSNDKTGEAIAVLREILADVAANGLTEAEIAAAKTYLTGSYPLRFDGNGQIAEILVGMQLAGLPADYIQARNARIEAVTDADLRRVATRLIRPDRLFVVVAGQPSGLAN